MMTVGVALAMTIAPSAQELRSAPQRESGPGGIKNVVLVHGAWADGSSWSKIIPLLRARGLHVVAVQNHLASFEDDVETTRRAIANQDGPVLLVGHSYGGAVITQAGNDPKVAGLVYIAAFAPDEGEAPFNLLTAYPTPIATEFRADQFGFITLTPRGIRRDFAQDLSAPELTAMIAAQGPTAAAAGSTPITAAAWKSMPTWFIVAKHDRTIAPELQWFFAQRMNAITTPLDTSHVPMLSRPRDVAAVIVRAAARAGR